MILVTQQNARYLEGLETYFLKINKFGDMTFEEFAAANAGLVKFNKDKTGSALFSSRGNIPINSDPPDSIDFSQTSCPSVIRCRFYIKIYENYNRTYFLQFLPLIFYLVICIFPTKIEIFNI